VAFESESDIKSKKRRGKEKTELEEWLESSFNEGRVGCDCSVFFLLCFHFSEALSSLFFSLTQMSSEIGTSRRERNQLDRTIYIAGLGEFPFFDSLSDRLESSNLVNFPLYFYFHFLSFFSLLLSFFFTIDRFSQRI
jgi:hypothetical protein